jgi:hypothetical protein
VTTQQRDPLFFYVGPLRDGKIPRPPGEAPPKPNFRSLKRENFLKKCFQERFENKDGYATVVRRAFWRCFLKNPDVV